MAKAAKPAVTLKLNGKPFTTARQTASLDKLLKYLNSLPDDEIRDSSGLYDAGFNHHVSEQFRQHPKKVEGYSLKVDGKLFYGNPKAIQALRDTQEAD